MILSNQFVTQSFVERNNSTFMMKWFELLKSNKWYDSCEGFFEKILPKISIEKVLFFD